MSGQANRRSGKRATRQVHQQTFRCTAMLAGGQADCRPGSQAAGQPGGQWCWQVGLPVREELRSFVLVIPKGFLLLSCAKLFGLVRCDGKCLSYRVGPFSTPSFAVFVGSALCCLGFLYVFRCSESARYSYPSGGIFILSAQAVSCFIDILHSCQ